MIIIQNSKLRHFLKKIIPVVGFPAFVLMGSTMLNEKYHLAISFLGALAALLLFVTDFEKKKTGTRRIVVVSVMTAMCFIGRFLPVLMPMTAFITLTGVYIGSESGFLVGALSVVLSNFYFGQGPWTIFQMLAWGMIGYIAGILANPLKRNLILLMVYGAVAGVLYSFIMDIWTVLWYNKGMDWNLYRNALITAIPYTVSYAVSGILFLGLLAKPFGEKLERIKIKYGI